MSTALVRVPAQPPAFVVKIVEWFRGALAALHRKLAPPPVVMLELLTAYIVPRAIYVVAKLGIAVSHAARRTGHHVGLERNLLAGLGAGDGEKRRLQRGDRTQRVGQHRLPGQPHR